MDSVFKIKRACFQSSELKPGHLFAFTPTSPFIRLYLGKNSSGYHLFRTVRSYNHDVHCGVVANSCLHSVHLVVARSRSISYGY